MLENRDYMRQPEYPDSGSGWKSAYRPRWSCTVTLLAIYVLVFIAELVAQKLFPENHFFRGHTVLTGGGVDFLPGYLPLSVAGLEHGYVWQLLTYQFMHSGLLHLFFNGWAIFFFGRELEHFVGGKKFLALALSSGIVGGVFQVLVALLWPQYFGGSVVGASASAFGLVAAYATLFPERELQLLLFFVIPVHLRARTLLIGSAVLAVAGFAFHDVIMPGVAHAAHLGGMAMGWFFVRKIMQGNWPRLSAFLSPAKRKNSPRGRAKVADEKPAGDFMENEVNPILDKISAHGIQSLTARERQILEAAGKRVRRS
jgi:membrane associated rhomboid family serine protease